MATKLDMSRMGDLADPVHDKTPWNPSRKAMKRVPQPHRPIPTECPHCAGRVECVKNSEIYNGMEYGDWPWAYLCRNQECGAYVGLHPFTSIPLGTLATFEIREARKVAKGHFMKLHWPSHAKAPFKTRTEAYVWLREAMGLSAEDCHFALFNVKQCMDAIALILERLRK